MTGRSRLSAALVVLAVVGGLSLTGCGLTPMPPARPTVTVTAPVPEPSMVPTVIGGGNVYLWGTNTHWTAATRHPRVGDSCSSAGAFAQAGKGGTVIVRGRDRLAVASSTLGEGTVTSQEGEKIACMLSFIVEVPSGRGPYTFEIGNYVWDPITQAQMLAGWRFTLGTP